MLERHSERRDEPIFIEELSLHAARAVVIAGETPVLKRLPDGSSSPFFTREEAMLLGEASEVAFLGADEDGAVFAMRSTAPMSKRSRRRASASPTSAR